MPSLPAGYQPRAPRAARRRLSRDTARQQTRAMHGFMGTTPRNEPARNDSCERHHRRRPCRQCA
jgi:hypothetical protein